MKINNFTVLHEKDTELSVRILLYLPNVIPDINPRLESMNEVNIKSYITMNNDIT